MGSSTASDVTEDIVLNVNGHLKTLSTDPATPLIFVLRNELGLTGPKLGCGLEQCGACAVLVDGKEVLSCNTPVGGYEGKHIVTPECMEHEGLAKVRDAFVRVGAAQCGYCIPGMVIAVTALFHSTKKPNEHQIRDALERHLCRCGTQPRVLAAIKELSNG